MFWKYITLLCVLNSVWWIFYTLQYDVGHQGNILDHMMYIISRVFSNVPGPKQDLDQEHGF